MTGYLLADSREWLGILDLGAPDLAPCLTSDDFVGIGNHAL